MRRALRAYMELEISTKLNEDEIQPSVGEYAVTVGGKVLSFDFNDSFRSVERNGDVLRLSTEQRNLDIASFRPQWIEDGLIHTDTPDEEIEDHIFNIIKSADSVHEIYLDIFIGEKNNCFEEAIIIKSFMVVDAVTGEEINFLKKVLDKDCFPENVMAHCQL